ncbi:hypothetical protein Micbo1qcDRAFT_97537, partial [Microdochium bolleyi]
LSITGPNERRTISREDLGLYGHVVVGATYTFGCGHVDWAHLQSPAYYYDAVRRIVEKHPFLTVVVKDKHGDKAYYEHVSSLDLAMHVSVVSEEYTGCRASAHDIGRIERLLPPLVDCAYPPQHPPWSVRVLPLSDGTESPQSPARCFIAFVFSHTLGDGINGLTFHQGLLDGLRNAVGLCQDAEAVITVPPSTTLPEPFDTAVRLPISWGYLLPVFFASCLPQWLAILLGIRASTSKLKPGTWTTTDTAPTDETQLRLIEIPAEQVVAAVAASREHGAKLTAVLHQFIVHGLSGVLPPTCTELVSQTAINMRPILEIPSTTMGLYVNGCFCYHSRTTNSDDVFNHQQQKPLSKTEWIKAAAMTQELKSCASRLTDQPVGLLRYARSIRSWIKDKVGQSRDCSYEVSNLLNGGYLNHSITIERAVFAHSRNPTSAPLVFGVVSVKGGSMVIAVIWQAGALG